MVEKRKQTTEAQLEVIFQKPLTNVQAGKLIKLSEREVRKLATDGYIDRAGKERIPLIAAVHGRIDSLRDERKQNTKSAESRRVATARAREIELKIEEREGRRIPTVEVMDLFAEYAGNMKAALLGLPARVTRDPVLRRTIELEINDTLRNIADSFETAAANLAIAGSHPAADNRVDA